MDIIASKRNACLCLRISIFSRIGEWKSGNNSDQKSVFREVKEDGILDRLELNLKEDGITHEMHLCLHRQF